MDVKEEVLEIVQQILSLLRLPQARARMIAHRYGIPWHQVEDLSARLTSETEELLVRAQRELGHVDSFRFFPLMDSIDEMFMGCQSPIEELFLATFDDQRFAVSWERAFILDFPVEGLPAGAGNKCAQTESGGLYMQYPVGKYRVDFALMCHGEDQPGIAIELDGHAFHERTKEQAQRDKSRDRVIQADGWHMLRFTGSEVWSDPAKCVSEVLSVGKRMREARR